MFEGDSDDDEGMIGFDKLFVCEVYVEKTWTIGTMSQSLLCSNMSSTDHDLTGQIVWPASIYGAWIVNSFPELFRDKSVVELGAGCGLYGFMASQVSKKVVITDGNDVVMKLLEKNLKYAPSESTFVRKLMWGIKSEVLLFNETYGIPEVIIGADVILWPNYVEPLLQTIRWMLSCKPNESRCYISYVQRAVTTTALLEATAVSKGLSLEWVYPSSFLSQEVIDANFKTLDIRMIKLQILDPVGVSFETELAETEQCVSNMNSAGAPC